MPSGNRHYALSESEVKESYRVIPPQDAGLEKFAAHGSLDDEPHGH